VYAQPGTAALMTLEGPSRASACKEERRPRKGRPRTVFVRALQHGNLLVAEATARELGRISLEEALELTILIAQREPRRLSKVAVRWLERYLQEREVTLSEVALAVAALSALADEQREEATHLLRALAGSF
jgi:hypothetical protein